ncbi:hypothetical protein CAL7716_085060 [Calothrix sp. PCC 7716]|nr:hypothetical protein CAL7716_085060 [Calothrix sp. PCC 7716]
MHKIKVFPGLYNPFVQEYKHYYHVCIFDVKEEMWEVGRKLSTWEKDKGGYGAITIPTWREKFVDGQLIKAPKIGTVLFYKDLLGSETISHEAVHMATSYLRILDQLKLSNQIDENEEKLAYCIGSCTRQIVDNLYKLKIL